MSAPLHKEKFASTLAPLHKEELASTFAPLRSLTPTLGRAALRLGVAAVLGTVLAGCIADTAEDTDLPWASNKNWEGIAPVSPAMMDRYD